MKKAIFNWSGGKDSAFALYKCLQNKEYDIVELFTSANKSSGRVSMHGVRKELINKQAENIGFNISYIELPDNTSMKIYENLMFEKMNYYKQNNVEYSIFGDIFLEDLKKYREKQLAKIGLKPYFPIWKEDTSILVNKFIDLGFKAIVTAIDASKLDKEFAGRIIDKQFIKDLPEDVDPCGENGEFHSFVFDGPIFKESVKFKIGNKVLKEYEAGTCSDFDDIDEKNVEIKKFGFWFCDLILDV